MLYEKSSFSSPLKFPATSFSVWMPLKKFRETFRIFKLGREANENQNWEALCSELKELKLISKSSRTLRAVSSSGSSFKSLPERFKFLYSIVSFLQNYRDLKNEKP